MKNIISFSVPLLSLILLSGCGGSDSTSLTSNTTETASETVTDIEISEDVVSNVVDTTLFPSTATITQVSCTLSNGASSTCYSITVNGFPSDRTELGPFCPQTETTQAADAGKWFDDGVLYDLTGEFVSNLGAFYGDSTWDLFDSSGAVNITDTQTSCEAAARPDVDAAYNNFCVECDINYYNGSEGEGVASTFIIPVTPVARTNAGSVGNNSIGVAFNGVTLDAPAPTSAILSAYTIAAFDDCVGHVNPFAGYHYHGANHGEGTCPAVEFEADGHAGGFGYALDGYIIYSMLDENGEESTDLDSCRGHSDDVRGYHYHSAGAGENMFIGCFSGETAQ